MGAGFQSIGVTKDWRRAIADHAWGAALKGFQSIGVTKDWRRASLSFPGNCYRRFPINRRHQGLATLKSTTFVQDLQGRCFQSIGVTKDWRPFVVGMVLFDLNVAFPINRRHQGLATPGEAVAVWIGEKVGFQSIGVTKDWRLSV